MTVNIEPEHSSLLHLMSLCIFGNQESLFFLSLKRALWQLPADLVTMDDSDNNILSVHLNIFSPADCSGPISRSRGPTRRPADIPPIDPTVLLDLQRHTQEVAHSVEMMMRSLNGTIQNVSLTGITNYARLSRTSDFRLCD